MVRIRFFPFDVTYRIVDDKAVIHLYGRTADGNDICIIDDNFRPYFYVFSGDLEKAKLKIEQLKVERERIVAFVTGSEIVKKL